MKKNELRAMLEANGLRPNSRFGQNFLIDESLLAKIPEDAGLSNGDYVLEVGPGAGALTNELLKCGTIVTAVELDRGLADLLRQRFASQIASGQFTLLEGDALGKDEQLNPEVEAWMASLDTPPYIVANLPYAISGPFLARLPGRSLAGVTLLLQKEVAEKVAGPTRQQEWSALSVRIALCFDSKLGRRLPPDVFWPRPQIDSAFLQLSPLSSHLSHRQDSALNEVLRFAFSQRRKQLLGRLRKKYPQWSEALEAEGIVAETRPGNISPNVWLRALNRVNC
ncbi:MAG: 16S rRNA (adenine(1518)-N(6)/adenine(1519)-N(6))-dimethyltransferase RsmA [Planctomycetota bacterium]|jgi:16S rRNA (adenine1518-N6/adenine1519-N6)-dimethyltransferase|nr:16S rRNA (adenine(1518)-N(6)/adenine(1519)-N(6))-dimethyltransferase RsmA [Planctomycetota bacterium]